MIGIRELTAFIRPAKNSAYEGSATIVKRPFVQEPKITVVFRYDDYSNWTSADLEVKIINSFKEHGFRFKIAAIPYLSAQVSKTSLDDEGLSGAKARILKNAIKAGIAGVALHGFCHHQVRLRGGETEFEGVPLMMQMRMITKGKSYLEQLLENPVSVFVPPWNSYDANTIRALEKLGFLAISAGLPGYVPSSSSLAFLPSTVGLRHLPNAIAAARRSRHRGQIIVILFHDFDFIENDRRRGKIMYREFEELLNWVSSQEDVAVRSIGDTMQVSGCDLSANRLAENNLIFNRYSRMPPLVRLFIGKSSKVYWTTEEKLDTKLKLFIGMYCLAELKIDGFFEAAALGFNLLLQ
ncbi:MAG: DUF2334 domain-containing protein [Acidobacteria bacterium]|nr:DUF2334 domain-containing protein [Acidobacteriota bacterium]